LNRTVLTAVIAGVVLVCAAALLWWLRPGLQAPTAPLLPGPPTTPPAPTASEPRPDPPLRAVRPARPGLESDWDKALLGSHAAAIQTCADQYPATPPGNLRLRVRLTADGAVKEVDVTDRKFQDLEIAGCVTHVIGSKHFPAGEKERTVTHIFRVR
jgi:hypothetical protein